MMFFSVLQKVAMTTMVVSLFVAAGSAGAMFATRAADVAPALEMEQWNFHASQIEAWDPNGAEVARVRAAVLLEHVERILHWRGLFDLVLVISMALFFVAAFAGALGTYMRGNAQLPSRARRESFVQDPKEHASAIEPASKSELPERLVRVAPREPSNAQIRLASNA